MQASASFVRIMDNAGKVNIPAEYRTKFNIKAHDYIEIYVDEIGNQIYLKKYIGHGCYFCENIETELFSYREKLVCHSCAQDISFRAYQEKVIEQKRKLKIDGIQRGDVFDVSNNEKVY
ncbi:hypothetical protein Elgi_37250 [Paenibacillus elgii]|uniref:AbrB/MazE/SpoVT family DNA-binding domain-containing protein n=1 Tax=Paenibacillus elgii TaxID=189691 RepID=UPI002D7C7FE8|nr:hypothetical protein Elgi_37250 [Paenibacillus elgii]